MNIDVVKDYYGKVLKGSEDLQTSACCDVDDMPRYLTRLIANVHDEVVGRYYGCGLCIPTALENCNVLDLGSGAGRDVYILSQLVGEKGFVTGVDMTAEQLATAEVHKDWHTKKFGYAQSNVRFLEGYLEKLDALELDAGAFDVIVSNCVINLCLDKLAVLRGAYNLLKQGGELYFADVYCDRRLPEELRADPLLYGECLGGRSLLERLSAHGEGGRLPGPAPRQKPAHRNREPGHAREARPCALLLRHLPPVQTR